jgi:hypothetical protein
MGRVRVRRCGVSGALCSGIRDIGKWIYTPGGKVGPMTAVAAGDRIGIRVAHGMREAEAEAEVGVFRS